MGFCSGYNSAAYFWSYSEKDEISLKCKQVYSACSAQSKLFYDWLQNTGLF